MEIQDTRSDKKVRLQFKNMKANSADTSPQESEKFLIVFHSNKFLFGFI
jgi:hypothetical protein